jgi:hypothetical protein
LIKELEEKNCLKQHRLYGNVPRELLERFAWEAFIPNADQSLTMAKHISRNTTHGKRQAHLLEHDGSGLCNRVSRNEERVALQKFFYSHC